ncbi:MAG: SHOCT domain-containing protein [Dehalococcoidia bacterium]
MWGWHAEMGWGWWLVGPLMMIGFWGGVIWLVASLVRRPPGSSKSPIDVARERYANGDIDESEFQTIVRNLNV